MRDVSDTGPDRRQWFHAQPVPPSRFRSPYARHPPRLDRHDSARPACVPGCSSLGRGLAHGAAHAPLPHDTRLSVLLGLDSRSTTNRRVKLETHHWCSISVEPNSIASRPSGNAGEYLVLTSGHRYKPSH
jgi:hypothetical protein